MNDVEVRNNSSESRYEVWADGQLAGYTQYVLRPGRIAFLHTEVHEPYEGQGLGGQLAHSALVDARARGLLVMPFCPFIAAYIEGHLDEYGDVVDPEMLSGDRDHKPEPSPKQGTREKRLGWSMRSPGRALCSWPGSRAERRLSSTDRTWADCR